MNIKHWTLLLVLPAMLILSSCQTTGGQTTGRSYSNRSDAAKIDRDVSSALTKLLDENPGARALAQKARGILVFPNIVKGGFMVGAHYGEGALRVGGRTVGYYNSVAASYGLQAGVQSFGYALFFMTQSSLNYLDRSEGWEIGVDPNIVIVNVGAAGALTTTTGQADIYAFFFDQKGLMGGISLQGSKISRINP